MVIKHTALESMCVIRLGRVVQQLVEAHRVGTELVKVVLVIAETHGHGAHNLLCELHDAVEVVHAGAAEGLGKGLWPYIGPMSELLCPNLRVVKRQVARHVVAFFQVRLSVGFDHLSVHDLITTVVRVLALMLDKIRYITYMYIVESHGY